MPPSTEALGGNLPPVIVLVRPQLGENIGKAARAMLNFGLVEMRLVTPRDGWPNPSAGPAAAGADVVLEKAQVFESLAEAVADCAHVYATTVRKRGVTKPVLTPDEAAQAVHRELGRSAFVFGPERSGLDTDDVALARAIVTVPQTFERQCTTVEALVRRQALKRLGKKFQSHLARHPMRADDDGAGLRHLVTLRDLVEVVVEDADVRADQRVGADGDGAGRRDIRAVVDERAVADA